MLVVATAGPLDEDPFCLLLGNDDPIEPIASNTIRGTASRNIPAVDIPVHMLTDGTDLIHVDYVDDYPPPAQPITDPRQPVRSPRAWDVAMRNDPQHAVMSSKFGEEIPNVAFAGLVSYSPVDGGPSIAKTGLFSKKINFYSYTFDEIADELDTRLIGVFGDNWEDNLNHLSTGYNSEFEVPDYWRNMPNLGTWLHKCVEHGVGEYPNIRDAVQWFRIGGTYPSGLYQPIHILTLLCKMARKAAEAERSEISSVIQRPSPSDLPPGWTQSIDPRNGIHHYYNPITEYFQRDRPKGNTNRSILLWQAARWLHEAFLAQGATSRESCLASGFPNLFPHYEYHIDY